MLRDAINEIRLHPGRFVATLVAIAISVGFVVAISVMVASEQRSLANANNLDIAVADVVVSLDGRVEGNELEAIGSTEGVAAAQALRQSFAMLSTEQGTVMTNLYDVPDEEFRWAEIAEGRWPESASEIALSGDGLDKLGAAVGDTIENYGEGYLITGRTDDARSLYATTAYTVIDEDVFSSRIAVKTDGTSVDEVVSSLRQAFPQHEVEPAADVRQAALDELTGDFDIFRNVLYVFAAIALVVGMIIISNTFTILVTQRRRQIGLLRAVGASTGQVRGRLVIESILLGLLGAVLGVLLGLGVSLVGASITGSLFWGLNIRPLDIAIAMGVGVIVTLLSVLGPSLAATKVAPIEALQVVPSAAQSKRIGVLRIAACILFGLLGAGLVVMSFLAESWHLLYALPGGVLLSIALLAGAPLYIAPILRLLGRVFGGLGPTVRLAAENSARNPRRAAATAVALMLAVGLVVTLQVGVSTTRSSAMDFIDERYPIDLVMRTYDAQLAEADLERVRAMESVEAVVTVPGKDVELGYSTYRVRDVNTAQRELDLSESHAASDGTIVLSDSDQYSEGDSIELPGTSGPITLTVVTSPAVGGRDAAVSAETFQALAGEASNQEAWVKLVDRTSPQALRDVITAAEAGAQFTDGGALIAGTLERVLDVILLVLTALLGVAVVIALVGVGNTLGLSVIERQRESALLRALGMQRRSLKWMLLIEALLLSLVGVGIGILGGAFFGWLGVTSGINMVNAEVGRSGDSLQLSPTFSVNVEWTAGLIAVTVAAAALASVLPGRRAANATPTEALATD